MTIPRKNPGRKGQAKKFFCVVAKTVPNEPMHVYGIGDWPDLARANEGIARSMSWRLDEELEAGIPLDRIVREPQALKILDVFGNVLRAYSWRLGCYAL